MRTTLSIDDDLLEMAKARAKAERRTTGEVICGLLREGLKHERTPCRLVDGVPVYQSRPGARPMTLEQINALREAE